MQEFHRSISFHHGPSAYRSKHAHPEGQLFMLTSGMATFAIARSNWVVLPHSLCWIPPDVPHEVFSSGNVTGMSLKIHPQLCQELPVGGAVLKSQLVLPALLRRMMEPMPSERLGRLTLVLIDELRGGELHPPQLPMPRSGGLRTVAAAIAKNPQTTRSIGAWCRELNMAQRTFLRRFPLETGLTYVSWRQRARILTSLELLRDGLPVAEAALAVGYLSLSSYMKLFKKLTGVSTRQFLAEARPDRDAGADDKAIGEARRKGERKSLQTRLCD